MKGGGTLVSNDTSCTLRYYCAFHDVVKRGMITALNTAYRKLKLDDEIIKFDDIYAITVIDF